jgi:hypothetical protein
LRRLGLKTKVFEEEFKGHKLLAVWSVDQNDEKIGRYPLVSLGKKKLEVLLSHITEVRSFVDQASSKEPSNEN